MTTSEKDVLTSDVVETKDVSNVTEKSNKRSSKTTNETEKISVHEFTKNLLKVVFNKKTDVSEQVKYYVELTNNRHTKLDKFVTNENNDYNERKNDYNEKINKVKTMFNDVKESEKEHYTNELQITQTNEFKELNDTLNEIRNDIIKDYIKMFETLKQINEYIHTNELHVYNLVEKELEKNNNKKDDKKETTKKTTKKDELNKLTTTTIKRSSKK